jgi:hypothetical protein
MRASRLKKEPIPKNMKFVDVTKLTVFGSNVLKIIIVVTGDHHWTQLWGKFCLSFVYTAYSKHKVDIF